MYLSHLWLFIRKKRKSYTNMQYEERQNSGILIKKYIEYS